MDKLKVTNHINDDELRVKMYKIVDLCNVVLKNYEEKSSDFLNPFEIKNAISIVNSDQDIDYIVEGGYDGAERQIIKVFPYYIPKEDVEESISVLQIDGNFKFTSVSHRDYLGSLLGLGIKREKIGDILVHDNFCQVVVDKEISDFIIFNLKKVGNNKVKISEIDKSDIKISEQEFEERSFTVSSMRLDSVVAGAYNLSRQKACNVIETGFVKVNYENILKPSYLVSENSVVSVRKKGKFVLSKIGSITRKDKIRINVKKYK